MQVKGSDYKPREIVRFIREWTGLTQEQFAKSIHRSKKTIEAYEYGKVNVSLATLQKMCKVHDIEIIIRKK